MLFNEGGRYSCLIHLLHFTLICILFLYIYIYIYTHKNQKRIARHEANRVFELTSRLNELTKNHLAACVEADRLRRLVRPSNRPKLIYGHDDNVSCVSSTDLQGFDNLRESIMSAATRLFRSHVGTKIPTTYQIVESEIKRLRRHSPIISFSRFIKVLNEENLPVENEDKVVDALHFLSNNGEVCFFWDLVKVSYIM